MLRRLGASCALILLAVPSASAARTPIELRFGPPRLHQIDHDAWAWVDTGDVTGDGRRDVVVAVSEAPGRADGIGAVLVFPQTSGGLLGPPSTYLLGPVGTGEGGMAVGDVDGDGRKDVVAGMRDGVAILSQRSDGTLNDPRFVATDAVVAHIDVVDVDRDGTRDVVVGGIGIAILFGEGGGAFSETPIGPPGYHLDIAVGDVDGNGLIDVVGCEGATNCFPTKVPVMLQTSPRSFTTVRAPGAERTGGVVVGDVFEGGGAEILVWGVRTAIDTWDGSAFVLARRVRALSAGAVHDLNRDGQPDILNEWSGEGQAVLVDPVTERLRWDAELVWGADGPQDVAVADVTGDQRPDVIAVGWTRLAIVPQLP